MKRILAILMALTLIFTAIIPAFAAECQHNFIRNFVGASCVEKGHTAYLCRKCGYSYKVYDDEYTTPDSLYILAKSVREGSTLTVTVDLYNNTGLTAARIKVGYNASTLALREFINGEIWSERDYTGGIHIENNPLSLFTENYLNGTASNKKNGRYFTLVFDILDPCGEYNMYFSSSTGDFHVEDENTGAIIKYPLTVVSLVGKSELGDHSYTESTTLPTCTEGGKTDYTCIFCGDHHTKDEKEPLGHSWEHTHTPKEPTITEEGLAIYTCSACGEFKTEAIPTLERWMKGDLNNDGDINSLDSNLLKRMIVGIYTNIQAFDAADIDEDGDLTAADSHIIKNIITGRYH